MISEKNANYLIDRIRELEQKQRVTLYNGRELHYLPDEELSALVEIIRDNNPKYGDPIYAILELEKRKKYKVAVVNLP